MNTNNLLPKIQFLPRKIILLIVQKIQNENIKNISYVGFTKINEPYQYFFIAQKEDDTFLSLCFQQNIDNGQCSYKKDSKRLYNNLVELDYITVEPESSNPDLELNYNQNDWLLHRDLILFDEKFTCYTNNYFDNIIIYKEKLLQHKIKDF